MILLQCRNCKGTGEIDNEQFRICKDLSPETKRYFHIQTEDSLEEADATSHDACRSVPEKVQCPVCEGVGIIVFDEDEWELKIVADSDQPGGE